MNIKRKLLIIFLIFFSIALLLSFCKTKKNNASYLRLNTIQNIEDLNIGSGDIENLSHEDLYYDSLRNANKLIDTSEIKGKIEYTKNLIRYSEYIHPLYDTLIDLNYDNYLDYVIGYYGDCGTGIKNKIFVFLYNNEYEYFKYNENLYNVNKLDTFQ